MVTTNRIVLAGEVRAGKPGNDKAANKQLTKDIIASLQPKVRAAVKDIGYAQKGFHWEKARYACYLHGQSAHIAQGVDSTAKKDEGAGDQGIMFGYACKETPELMPATLQYSHNILKRLAEVRHSGERPEFEPDAKSQVTLRYENGKPAEVVAIVVSHQHTRSSAIPRTRRSASPIWFARMRNRFSLKASSPRKPSGTSTRPASLKSAVRTATAV